jgi:long-chain acyl-CoA synthetase
MEDLVMNEPVEELIEKRIAEVNAKLARWETIKRFIVLPRDFTIEGGELTPTLKLKRKVIVEKYSEKIEGMYADSWHSRSVGNGNGNGNGNANGQANGAPDGEAKH